MSSLEVGDVDGVAAMFNLPPMYSKHDSDEERRVLREMLSVVCSEFGQLQDRHRSKGPFLTYEITVGSGDLGYQRSLHDVKRYIYDVHFAAAGRGVVTGDIVSIGGIARPQRIHFGVRTNEPDAMGIVGRAGAKEMDVVLAHRTHP